MTNPKSIKLSFNSILVQDPTTKGYTAFFKEFPEIIAEGDTEDHALLNLIHTLQDVFEYKSKQTQTIDFPDTQIIEKPINFYNNNLETV